MSKVKTAAKIIVVLGVLVFLKIYLGSATRISEPVSNIAVLVGFAIFAIVLGYNSILKESHKRKEEGLK